MFKSFHVRTLLGLIAACVLLAVGLYLFLAGQAAQRDAQKLAARVAETRVQVEQLAATSRDYAELIRRISWRPGIELRREKIDLTGKFAGNDLDSINQMFAVSYSGKGYFSLNSFLIEDATPQPVAGSPFTVKVSLRGDNILVMEPR